MKIKYKTLLFFAAILLFAVIFSGINNANIADNNKFNKYDSTESQIIGNAQTQTSYIHIDIKGKVKNPGFYKLESESRLYDLINLAGGFDDANEICYNLAQKLNDGTQIIIKDSNEACENSQLININTASLEELTRIKGIGPGRADSIIDHRNKNGMFGSIEEIKNVSGIGEATYEKLKDQITT